jgi:hypothetical protein
VALVAGGIGDALKKARLERAFLLPPILPDALFLRWLRHYLSGHCNPVAIYSV